MISVEVHSNNVLTLRNDTFANAVSDSVKHETVKFLFSDNWKDYQKTAVFSAEGVEPINIVLGSTNELCLSEDECYIPFEVLTGDSFTLSVFGVSGDKIATATQEKIRIFPSGYALGDAPQDPTPDEYSQLVAMMTKTQEIAQSVRTDADNGLFDGKDGLKGEKGDKGDQGEKGTGVGEATEQGGEIFNDYENNKATGKFSHASGINTEAGQDGQFVVGHYNSNKGDTVFEVGNGNTENRSNAFEVYEDGHAEVMSMGTNPTDNTVATKQYVDEEIATFDFIKVVDALPTTALVNKIYLVPSQDPQEQNLFDEYIWTGDKWEYITTKPIEVDLTQYYQKSQVDAFVSDLQDSISKSWQSIYPVGSVYLAPDSTINPSVLFGGKWERQTVKRTVANRTKIEGFEANTRYSTIVENLSEYKLLSTGYCINITPFSGAPNLISLSASDVAFEDGYISSFNIVSYRTDTTAFTAFWSITSNSETDDNGYYHWKRIG